MMWCYIKFHSSGSKGKSTEGYHCCNISGDLKYCWRTCKLGNLHIFLISWNVYRNCRTRNLQLFLSSECNMSMVWRRASCKGYGFQFSANQKVVSFIMASGTLVLQCVSFNGPVRFVSDFRPSRRRLTLIQKTRLQLSTPSTFGCLKSASHRYQSMICWGMFSD